MENSDASRNQGNAAYSCFAGKVALTPRRMEVYTTLLRTGRPMSAYDVIEAVNREFSRQLTPMSVYRMLDFLEQHHLVRKLKSASKYIAVEPTATDAEGPASQYLICRECGEVKVLCLDQRVLGDLKNCVNSSGFRLRNLELELDCVCDNCAVTD